LKSIERLNRAINFQETDRPPHFELCYQLVEEAFGKSFPPMDLFDKATAKEKDELFNECAELHAKTIERFKWDAINVWYPGNRYEIQCEIIPCLKKYIGDDFPIFAPVWLSFISLETVDDYMEFSIQLAEEPDEIHKWAASMLKKAKMHLGKLAEAGAYGVAIANDSAFNDGPFLSPAQHEEYVVPYLSDFIHEARSYGLKVLYHTDGNLMKILNQIIECRPDILHSIDPMANMDIKTVKGLTYNKVALMGNVQCNYLQCLC